MTLAGPTAATPDVPAVWYRASETCPNGTQFLSKLAESERSARLAQAGDHIDFVVTLVADGQETVGRLERQTNSGTVAIRELRDATCEQVADALALSLGLAMTRGQPSAGAVDQNPAEGSGHDRGVPTENTPAPVPTPATVSDSATTGDAIPAATPPNSAAAPPSRRRVWSVGADFGVMMGITPHPLPRGALFVDFRPALSHFLPNLSLRGSVVGSVGSSETAIGPVQRWILAGRAEACPVAWVQGRFDLRPCAGFELGIDNAAAADGDADLDDQALWAAPTGQLRLAFALQPKLVWLEASGGVLIPLIRKEIFSGNESLYRDAPVVFHAGLGVSLRLP
ncbi:MAG TPA: hypothetical protein VHM25_16125 [Polyangiaceae bacterium]|nr:hypothetical protein [Polyangiaceae bacterium]